MKDVFLVRLYGSILILAFVWALLGAPLLPQEWQQLPDRFTLLLHQLPHRMQSIFFRWH